MGGGGVSRELHHGSPAAQAGEDENTRSNGEQGPASLLGLSDRRRPLNCWSGRGAGCRAAQR